LGANGNLISDNYSPSNFDLYPVIGKVFRDSYLSDHIRSFNNPILPDRRSSGLVPITQSFSTQSFMDSLKRSQDSLANAEYRNREYKEFERQQDLAYTKGNKELKRSLRNPYRPRLEHRLFSHNLLLDGQKKQIKILQEQIDRYNTYKLKNSGELNEDEILNINKEIDDLTIEINKINDGVISDYKFPFYRIKAPIEPFEADTPDVDPPGVEPFEVDTPGVVCNSKKSKRCTISGGRKRRTIRKYKRKSKK